MLSVREDRRWLAVTAVLTLAELLWWALAWRAGFAPTPFLGTYLALALAGLGGALALRLALRRKVARAPWASVLCGGVLVAVGASLFLPLKVAIPHEIPFWLDQPLAAGERALFDADPWQLADRLLGWAAVPVDRLYGLWLPLQTLALFTVMLEPPSPAKSRALTAYSLAWFLLGVAAAALLSSAGPLFYDRLLGGSDFAALRETLGARGAWVALAESDRMYASLASNRPGFVAGISAAPSIHVAISLWLYLAARTMAPRAAPLALAYTLFIWFSSVQLGWHYVSDGLIGIAGMLAVWALAGLIERRSAPSQRP